MEIPKLAKLLQITNEKILRKSEEMVRLARVRCPSGIGTGELVKAAVCLELASKQFGQSFDKKKAIILSGATEKIYQVAQSSLQNILGIRPEISVKELAIQFGCMQLVKYAERLFEIYKQQYLAGIDPQRRNFADFSRPVFTAVAFYLSAIEHQVTVDKKLLIDCCFTNATEFNQVCESMTGLCTIKKSKGESKSNISSIKKKEKSSKKKKSGKLDDNLSEKRARDEEDELSDLEGEELEEGVEIPGLHKSKKRVKREDYDEWKEIVTKDEKPKLLTDPSKLKQTKINFLAKLQEET